ncbi:MAG: transposase, partial [Rhabdochlamydiaceae bacterium]
LMSFVPQMPEKVQYLLRFSFPLVTKLCEKSVSEKFIGGRPGYDKETLFGWLLIKKVTNWDYRTIASMAGVSHPTMIRANELFLQKHIYEKVLVSLVKQAYKQRLIKGRYVAMDSSFIHTFSKKGELGSEGWNDHKEGYGFKLHLLIDCETKFPIALCVTNGLANDMTLAIPLLNKARYWLKRCGYVLADKGYDWGDLVNWIAQNLHAKAGIPIKKYKRSKNWNWEGAWRNFQEKAKGRTLKKSIYNKRGSIERVFSVLKRTYHLGHEETRGILNFAKNCYLTLICYMLKLFNIAISV